MVLASSVERSGENISIKPSFSSWLLRGMASLDFRHHRFPKSTRAVISLGVQTKRLSTDSAFKKVFEVIVRPRSIGVDVFNFAIAAC